MKRERLFISPPLDGKAASFTYLVSDDEVVRREKVTHSCCWFLASRRVAAPTRAHRDKKDTYQEEVKKRERKEGLHSLAERKERREKKLYATSIPSLNQPPPSIAMGSGTLPSAEE